MFYPFYSRYTKGVVYTSVVTIIIRASKKHATVEVYRRITCMTTSPSRLTSTAGPLTCLAVGGADNNFSAVFTAIKNVSTGFCFSWNDGYGSAVEASNSSILTHHHRLAPTESFTTFTLASSSAQRNHPALLPLCKDGSITVDGTQAEDPDVWLCRKVNENFPANTMEMPLIFIQTNGNASLLGCFGKGPGPLNISTSTLNVNTGDLEPTNNAVRLRILLGDLRAELNQRLNAVAGNPPFLRTT